MLETGGFGPLRAAASSPSRGGFADVLPPGPGHRGEEREPQPAGTWRVVHPGQRPGEHLQDQAVRGEVAGQGGQLGGVPAQALHLADGDDDAAVRGAALDLPGEGERGPELRADPDPVPPEYSIAWLTCAVTCGLDAVAVGWPGLLMITCFLVRRVLGLASWCSAGTWPKMPNC